MKIAKDMAVLILAAGESSRMGKPKQLLSWGKLTLLNHTINQAKKLSDDVYVVLGANKKLIEPTIPSYINVIDNPKWKNGMGTSIAKGITELGRDQNYESALILLGDQPFLDAAYLLRLKKLFNREKCMIAATSYGDKNGVPAIFHNALFASLSKLSKDVGAKHLMNKYSKEMVSLNTKGKETDIDTMETYHELLERAKF